MKELLKDIAYTGIGAAFLTKEKIDIPTNANFADLCRQVEELQIALNKKPEA